MISNLPSVLIEEIFCRVPLKSLRAVRLACKSWNTLSKSRSFRKLYIGKKETREEEPTMIAMMNFDVHLMRLVVDDVNPSIKFKRKPSRLFDEQVKISQVFHCEGLLLCIFKDDDSKFVVWNPYSGKTRWIEPRYSHRPKGWDRFSYALGYENKKFCSGVKFLRFIDYFSKAPENQFFWYEIYDFDSDSWTSLDVTPNWCIMFGSLGVNFKGNTYWCATKRNLYNDSDLVDHIICFDFTRERFGPLLALPPSVWDHEYEYVTLSCVREEKLAALFQHYETEWNEFEIWITTKIDVEMVSWSKFLRMETGTRLHDLPHIYEGFFIDEEKKLAMGFEDEYDRRTFIIIGEAGYVRKFDIGVDVDRECWPHGCGSYVPSLVRIKKPARGKRKRQSSLEKRRFDQNKSRLEAFEKLGV
ncbi:PREDICTED: F-box protein At2g38590-like [Camelina sativa]|uniref:F-box protein At2g38590-like n=1 Tax=Camelina sativa TaxID=90675 RepID=A0ABM0ZB00_CAMSA|nr:PREDICTED: F-box protein At2g38590-like [Camelina sativa]